MYRNNCYETNKNYGIMADKIKTDALVHSEQYVSCVSFYFYCFFFFGIISNVSRRSQKIKHGHVMIFTCTVKTIVTIIMN